jgi:predicted RNA-binding protein with PIN domain
MRWLVDGYNVIRRSPEMAARERESLEAGRLALCRALAEAARASGDEFTVVFDGTQARRPASGGWGVRVAFSSARETADRVLARMAQGGGAVVSNDREVRRAAQRAGAIAVSTDEFLVRLERLSRTSPAGGEPQGDEEEKDDAPRGPKKGNPRRLSKKRRAEVRALGRLRPR